ncbi:MAG: PQQ-binding-like beta-propeller repeat protein [Deltaproteobacteria bacterium]|nr:PQQ-binding-like beta-propeller repeat protein [Deltaproteobacteria bacterium]
MSVCGFGPTVRTFFPLMALAMALFGAGCAASTPPPVAIVAPANEADFEPPLKIDWIAELTPREDEPVFMPVEFSAPGLDDNRAYVGTARGQFFAVDRSDGRVVWRYDAWGPVESTPAITADLVIFGDSEGTVYALNKKTGRARWTYSAATEILGGLATDGDRLFFGTSDNRVYCLDLATGQWKWTYQRELPVTFTIRGISTPVVRGDRVYMGFSDGYAVALNRQDGKEVWKNLLRIDDALVDVDATPLVVGDRLYIAAYDGSLYCLGAESGDVLWKMDNGGSISPPAVRGNYLFVAGTDGRVYGLSRADGSVLWQADIRDLDKDHSLAGAPRRRLKIPTAPLLVGTTLLTGSSDGYLYALDARDGSVLWRYYPGYGLSGDFAYADHRVYFLGNGGQLFALRPSLFPPDPLY